uniref:Amphinase-1 n=1 Tax=Steinernema glaseri TaxID=37863 RepID=A0A1I8AQH3_9BILA
MRFIAFSGLCLLLCVACGSSTPLQGGNGFTHDQKWSVCVAKRGGSFKSRAECQERTLFMDSQCRGPDTKDPAPEHGFPALQCRARSCPATHTCTQAMIALCCSKENEKQIKQAESDKCPDGSKALGERNGKEFLATFAHSCTDLVCGKKHKCVQVNKYFAKCCEKK